MSAARHTPSVSYNAITDMLTVDGYLIAGDVLRMLTVTPCGTMFRITSRQGLGITVTSEYHPLAAAAPALLESAREVMKLLEERGGSIVPHLLDTDMNPGQRLRDAIAAAERALS